jgi:hypothetical protein
VSQGFSKRGIRVITEGAAAASKRSHWHPCDSHLLYICSTQRLASALHAVRFLSSWHPSTEVSRYCRKAAEFPMVFWLVAPSAPVSVAVAAYDARLQPTESELAMRCMGTALEHRMPPGRVPGHMQTPLALRILG